MNWYLFTCQDLVDYPQLLSKELFEFFGIEVRY